MSVKIKNIDLFECGTDLIAHQVNCLGVMGAGIAKQIKDRYYAAYQDYLSYCDRMNRSPEILLGDVRFSFVYNYENPKSLMEIAHIFAQKSIGRNGVYTDYSALRKGLNRIRTYAELADLKRVAVPYKIGCGLGGGDWENVVLPILHDIFDNSKVELIICRKE